MAWCNQGHEYDPTKNPTCPVCGSGPAVAGKAAPSTVYEGDDGPLPPGWPPRPAPNFPGVTPGMGAPGGNAQMGGAANAGMQPFFQGGGAPFRPPMQAPGAGGGGPKTVMDDEAEAVERLMGFVVIMASKEDDEYRYMRLRKGVNFIGRFGFRSDIEIRDGDISGQHALIICTNNAVRLIDLDSTNGTKVNGERIEIAVLQEGDVISVGRTRLMFVPFLLVVEE